MERGGSSKAAGSATTRDDGADGHGEGPNDASAVASVVSRAVGTEGCGMVLWRSGGVGCVVRCGASATLICSTMTWPRVVGAERTTVVVWLFVSNAVVVWMPKARLGVS